MIVVPSIPHTGTHFVRDHLLRNLPEMIHVEHCWPQWDDERKFYTYSAELENKLIDARAILIPLRRPRNIASSWIRRGKPLIELPRWYLVVFWILERFRTKAFLLPIDDTVRRHRFLEYFCEHTQLELDTSWPIVREASSVSSGPVAFTDAQENILQLIESRYGYYFEGAELAIADG